MCLLVLCCFASGSPFKFCLFSILMCLYSRNFACMYMCTHTYYAACICICDSVVLLLDDLERRSLEFKSQKYKVLCV